MGTQSRSASLLGNESSTNWLNVRGTCANLPITEHMDHMFERKYGGRRTTSLRVGAIRAERYLVR